MKTSVQTWSVAEAFDRFGFDDGNSQHNEEVEDALIAHGYTVTRALTIHNNYITDVAGPGLFEELHFDGYQMPVSWDQLPEPFKAAILQVDPDFKPAEWHCG